MDGSRCCEQCARNVDDQEKRQAAEEEEEELRLAQEALQDVINAVTASEQRVLELQNAWDDSSATEAAIGIQAARAEVLCLDIADYLPGPPTEPPPVPH